MKAFFRLSFLSILLIVTMSASAKAPKDLSATDFFKNPDYSGLQLSPNGKYIAALMTVNDRNNIIVMNTENLADYQFLTGFKTSQVASYFWASNDRIVFTMDSSEGNEAFGLYTVTRVKKPEITTLLASKVTGRSIVSASVVNSLPDDENHIIVSYNQRYVTAPDLYKVALDGKWNIKAKRNRSMELIAKNPGDVQGWIVDNDGDVRGAISGSGMEQELHYKEKNELEFKSIRKYKVMDETISPLSYDYDNKTMYVASNIGRDTNAIYKYNPATDELGEMIYGNDKVDVTGLIMSRNKQKLTGISYVDDYPVRVFFDKEEEQFYETLKRSFPGKVARVVSSSRDENLRIIAVTSDRDPGTYYLFNKPKKSLKLLTTVKSSIDPNLMSAMTPFEFKSRDGLTLRGYVTIPKDAVGKVPLIINPHGGPFGVRDNWGFRTDTQFLASRGYAVAQVNFRGSGGYGRKFEQAGYGGKWGAEMQHDITDTVKYLVEQGIADGERVCIYGGSYGGYATMAGLTFTPDVYKCGINNVGVTDVGLLFTSMPKSWEPAKALLSAMIGDPEDKELMSRMSPIDHVENIKAPVFIIHGKNDPRVVYEHATMLKDKLDDLDKPYEWMIESNEGHGFSKQENRIKMFEKVEEFLAKNI